MVETLLPHNASKFERDLERATGPELLRPAPLREIWSPDKCPPELLPWLAHAFSVDAWDPEWPEATKREVIRQSVAVHRVKGTRGALVRALEAAGFRIDLVEGWEEGGAAHTFRLDAFGDDVIAAGFEIDANLRDRLDRLVDAVKPVRSHYTMRIGQTVRYDRFMRSGARGVQSIDETFTVKPNPRVSRAPLAVRSGARALASIGGIVRPAAPARRSQGTTHLRFGLRGRQVIRATFKFAQEAA